MAIKQPAPPAPQTVQPPTGAAYDIQGSAGKPKLLPHCRPTPPFMLTFHPERWGCMDDCDDGEFRVVPILGTLTLTGGASMVTATFSKETGRTTYYLVDAVKLKESRGYAAIQYGACGVSYCVPHEVRGGTAHLTPWQIPRVGVVLPRRIKGYVAWLVRLYTEPDARGNTMLPRPDIATLEGLEARTADELRANIDRLAASPGLAVAIKRIEACLAAIRAEMARVSA